VEELCTQVKRSVRKAQSKSLISRECPEACGVSAAEHSLPGRSTCASDTGSARCELCSHVVDLNHMQAQNCLRRYIHVRCRRSR
jgi:hypothetical protein